MSDTTGARGVSHPHMRRAECKDCVRELLAGRRPEGTQYFTYPESWANGQLERGGSRSDRCREHRAAHQSHISGIAVAYIDLDTVGEVTDREHPTGPLGALGSLPPAHQVADTPGVDLGTFGFGMDESHIIAMLGSLADPNRRVLVVKAGTGTGKSTYMPYKLLDPPAGCFRLADLGPIIVTEPRVQATVGVASFVGSVMSGAGGVGPGYPVGYQVSGDRQHDSACQLIYVTDGTMINWLREGRLSTIGTVIVDEAHERSTNIDFIMGYLRRELDRYPHLRVIITSATFDAVFYQQYFGGPERVGVVEVPAVKSIGYGWPLFPELDARPAKDTHVEAWGRMAPELTLAAGPTPSDTEDLIRRAWPRYAPPLKENEVVDPADIGYVEDLHATTRALMALRFTDDPIPASRWPKEMPGVVAEFVVRLAAGLDDAGIFGDILAFLPTSKAIDEACEIIRANLAAAADVYALLSTLPAADKEAALSARRKGDPRKIVVSTNLAETSLTVEGVRFVVDSGLIAQSEWDVDAAQGGIKTKAHSQAGIKQRWGRVGRKAPGWVFPLYRKDQLLELAEDTAPGSTRENLENLVMTAKLGGLASVHDIVWPAAFEPTPPVVLDAAAEAAREVFIRELERADAALRINGALDADGDPTSFGRELARLRVLGSTGAALAVMYADRLACVPEVATILALLNGTNLVSTSGLLLTDYAWPDEWRLEAAERHRALASACEDDAELVLQVVAGWERADPDIPPWDPSPARAAWAAQWWVNHETLLAAAATRRDILAGLSPAMKEEVKRFIEPALLRRARGAITRAFTNLEHQFDGTAFTASQAAATATAAGTVTTEPVGEPEPAPEPPAPTGPFSRLRAPLSVEAGPTRAVAPEQLPEFAVEAATEAFTGAGDIRVHATVLTRPPDRSVPLNRNRHNRVTYLANFVTVEPWARETTTGGEPGPASAIALLAASAQHARVEPRRDVLGAVLDAWPAGTRAQLRFARDTAGRTTVAAVNARHAPACLPAAAEELAELDASDELAHGGGTPTDASPELDTRWPTPNQPNPDPDALARRAVLNHRDVEADEYACRNCPTCLAGNLADCTNPRGLSESELFGGLDALAAWRTRATTGIDASMPLVLPAPGTTLQDGTWYEVTGYHISPAGEPLVVLRPDWRLPEDTNGPGEHPDLTAGNHIDVIVDGTIHDHHGDLRVLRRADGHGRFLLREADRDWRKQIERAQLAISLNSRDTGQLAELRDGATLTATALPRSQGDHFTITLLDLAAHHVEDTARSTGGHGNGRTTPAVIAGTPNSAGYVDVRLLAVDTHTGLRHVHSAQTGADAPAEGAPVLVDLRRSGTRLFLQGRPLADIRDVVDRLPDVRLTGLPDDGTLPTVGTRTARLEPTALVSTASALELAELKLDPTWSRDVWLFWARSRHQNVANVQPGTRSDPIDHPARPRTELPRELHLPPAEVREMHPAGTRTTAVVTIVNDDLRRAWLRLPDGLPASVAAKDVPARVGEPLSTTLQQGPEVTGWVTGVFEKDGKGMVTLRLTEPGTAQPTTAAVTSSRPTPPPVPTLQQARGTYPPGSSFTGVVQSVKPDLGRAWIKLPDGLQATVTANDIGPSGVLSLEGVLAPGQAVIGTSKGVTDRGGTPQVQAELRGLVTPTIWAQLDQVGVRPGAVLTGQVRNSVDTLGLFVELLRGVQGLVHVRTLAGRSPASFTRGTTVTVQVLTVAEDRKRPGRPAISLTLL